MIDILNLIQMLFNRKDWLKRRITQLNVKVAEANNKSDWIIYLESLSEKDFAHEVETNCASEKNSQNARGNAARESLKLISEYKKYPLK